MLEILRPTKAKIVGTLLLVIVDWVAGFISGQVSQLLVPKELIEAMTPAFAEMFTGETVVTLMVVGVVSIVLSLILKLVFFYTVMSFTIEKLAK